MDYPIEAITVAVLCVGVSVTLVRLFVIALGNRL